jgi:uncharacterized SAM-binding protein YcdF (DUF218 family)
MKAEQLAYKPKHHAPDVLIVLGKNIGIESTGEDIRRDNFHLSTDSRLNVLASGMLYEPGMIIFDSTGQTAGPDIPSEAEAMRKYRAVHFKDIPAINQLLEDDSVDTAGNAEKMAEKLREIPHGEVRLVTVGYHLENATKLFERYGVKIAKGYASEKEVKRRSSHHAAYIERWEKSERVKKEKRKELVRKGFLLVDRKGKIMHQVTKRSRG